MAGYPSEFYDGNSPLSFKGAVLFYHDHLIFFTDDEKVRERIDYNKIDTINKVNGQTRVACGIKSKKTLLLVINGEEAHVRFTRHYSESSSVSIFKRIPYIFRSKGKVSKAVFIITPLVTSGLIIYGLLFHLYWFIPVSVDITMGDRMGKLLESKFIPVRDRSMEKVVSTIAGRVVPVKSVFSYKVTVIEGNDLNAFALPGGQIYLFKGLVQNADSPEEIAAVIAHEAAHVENRHGLRQLIRITGFSYFLHMFMGAGFEEMDTLNTVNDLSTLFVFLHYSRQFEKEADLEAVRLLNKKNLPAKGLVTFLEKMKKAEKMPQVLNYVNSHPPTGSRIDYLNKVIAKETISTYPIKGISSDWKSMKR